MELKIETNFDFGKLSKSLARLQNNYLENYAEGSAKQSKSNIDSGLSPPLEDSTRAIRFLRDEPLSPPLKASGALYNSIRKDGTTLVMNFYGALHNKGFVIKNIPKEKPFSHMNGKKIPARKFISTGLKNLKRINEKFMRDFRNAFRK